MMTEPQRLEALIAAVNHLTTGIRAMEETLTQLVSEMREPPSSELPELMRTLIAQQAASTVQQLATTKAVEVLTGTVTRIGARVSELRDEVVKVTSG